MAKTIHVRNLSLKDGLSQSSVLCILQDRQGFMWFGTEDGLNRYDGYNFTVFRHDPADSFSLSDNHINCILEDHAGYLWIGTKDGGLNRFDPKTEHFRYWKYEEYDSTGLSSNHIQTIYEDDKNVLWIGTLNNGLYAYNFYDDQWKHYQFQENNTYPQALNTISSICPDGSSNKFIWLGTFYGLLHFNKETGAYSHWKLAPEKQNSISDNIIWDIETANTENDTLLLIATNDRVNIFDIKSKTFYSDFYNTSLSAGKRASRSIYKISNRHFWIGTMDGVLELFIDGNRHSGLRCLKTNITGLKDKRLLSIFKDKSGVLWLGSIISGVYSYSSKLHKFPSWTSQNSQDNFKLSNYSIRSLAQTKNNILWIGTEDKLNKIDLDNNTIHYWAPDIKLSGRYTDYYIWSLFPDRNDNLWIGTMGLGVFYLDTQKNSYRHWQLKNRDENSVNHNFIPCLLVDHRNKVWIGTWGGGLNFFDPEKDKFKYYMNNPHDPHSISHNSVWCLYEDSDKQIWAGTYGGGLNRYNPGTDQFTRFEYSLDNPDGINNNTIYCLVEDTLENLWIGTNNGLNKLNRKTMKFSNITSKDGLPNNVVYGILIDNNQRLWLSTNNGLSCFNPSNGEIKNYTIEEGLQNNEFNAGAYLKMTDGRLVFGGINGLNIFRPDSIPKNLYHPPVVFTDFKLYNQSVSHGSNSILKNPIQYTHTINLSYRDKVFSIDFAALDFNNPENNTFYYRLVGFDNDWIYSGNRNTAAYTNLNPGNYIFQVKGRNNDGIINEKPKQLFINIIPPYWQTIWFKTLIILLIIGLLYLLYRLRLNRALEMERMRIRIASDLHDDIGSTLTKIAINSEIIQSTKNPDKIKKSSVKIGKMSRDIISAMSDIIWSIDARNDSMQDLLDRMRDFSSTSFTDKNIKVNFIHHNIPVNKKIPVQFRQNVFLIFKEALHNILKHAEATQVRIEFTFTGSEYRLCITDNGIGFDSEATHSGNGIKNIQHRSKAINAEIEIENKEGASLCLRGKLP
ncbi:MAG: two-component regulator propeller domain-containing protein [Calditrichaceae bacterium]